MIYLSASQRQFHILPNILQNPSSLSNSYPYARERSMETVCNIFMMVFGVPRRESTTAMLTTEPSGRGICKGRHKRDSKNKKQESINKTV